MGASGLLVEHLEKELLLVHELLILHLHVRTFALSVVIVAGLVIEDFNIWLGAIDALRISAPVDKEVNLVFILVVKVYPLDRFVDPLALLSILLLFLSAVFLLAASSLDEAFDLGVDRRRPATQGERGQLPAGA